MYFKIQERVSEEQPTIIQAKNLEDAKEKAIEIGKSYNLQYVHFYKWNAGTGSLQGKDCASKRHCVKIK